MATSSSRGTAASGTSGGNTAPADRVRRPVLPPLIPPFRFACVEEGIYRGACPSLRNLRYLTRLNLRALISLLPDSSLSSLPAPSDDSEYTVPDVPVKDLREFCDKTNVRHYTHVLDKYDDGFSHTPELVASVLGQLLDKENHPVFIHCMDGRNNTGMVIMCLRKLQNWDSQAILDEFARYTKDNNFEYNEHMFVKNFNHPIAAPKSIPNWFLNRIKPSINNNNSPPDTKKDSSNPINHANHPANAPQTNSAGSTTPLKDASAPAIRTTTTTSSGTPNVH